MQDVENLPDSIEIYLFGSAIHHAIPSDLDILFLYDPLIVPPKDAYSKFSSVLSHFEERIGIPVHLTALTYTESIKSSFLTQIEAIRLRTS